jgi:hypothetical protein
MVKKEVTKARSVKVSQDSKKNDFVESPTKNNKIQEIETELEPFDEGIFEDLGAFSDE